MGTPDAILGVSGVGVIEQLGGELDAPGSFRKEELDPRRECGGGAEGVGDLVGGGELPEDGDSGAAVFAHCASGDGRPEGGRGGGVDPGGLVAAAKTLAEGRKLRKAGVGRTHTVVSSPIISNLDRRFPSCSDWALRFSVNDGFLFLRQVDPEIVDGTIFVLDDN